MFADFITKLIQPIVKIRRSEWLKAGMMFIYAFTIFATLYVFKPVRSSLYLDARGAENLWLAYFFEGVVLFVITYLYVKLADRFKNKNHFFTFTTLFLIFNILIFYFCFQMNVKESWLVLFFYGWVATYSVTVATQFWTMANDIFNMDEAKRLFGFIISGGSLGGVVGGGLTKLFAERFGTENLLLMPVLFLTISIIVTEIVWRSERTKAGPLKEVKKSGKHESLTRVLRLLFKSRYLLLIAGIVLFAKAVSTIVDNQFSGVVELAIREKDVRTAFFGGFFSALNMVSFILQLYVTSKVLRYLGISIALLMLPGGLLIGASLTILFPILPFAMAARMYDGGLNYSINLLSKEILYLPVASETRYRVKPVIDMLVFRLAKVFAAALIFIALKFVGLRVDQLGIVVLVILPFWLWTAWRVKHEYVQSIRQLLTNEKRVKRFKETSQKRVTDVLMNLFEEKSCQELRDLFYDIPSHMRKMSAAACLAFYGGGRDVGKVGKLVQEMVRYEALEYQKNRPLLNPRTESTGHYQWVDEYLVKYLKLEHPSAKSKLSEKENEILERISGMLQDTKCDGLSKRKAISILRTLGTQNAFDLLLGALPVTRDNSIRFDMIKGMNHIHTKLSNYSIPQNAVEAEVRYEIENHKAILTVIHFYKSQEKKTSSVDEDFLLATLKIIREESLERIFRLLGLIYPTEAIQTIFERLTDEEASEDLHGKSIAIELLGHIVKPELYHRLHLLVDHDRWHKHRQTNPKEVIKHFLMGEDCWFSVCAAFVIAELRMTELYSLFEHLSGREAPIVKEAVAIAKSKAESFDTGTNK
ncbi:MAG: hypothetical protein COV74_08200 [Candidatus Omnitrophica bacterium CG11_big_fil_rev_8_21_14_0_20_45_26]|uniref:ADP,ATP carrier protein n=1 Tax=Candidatus Abzuiibacterium crystallinum TaxID=1974748 RepID=A0A2H0LM79_9BACT|nr:MAG: hypothetical protein COV74_08200 [Candidatus Omnitrophica bacterium CG11_big_fil_rev_8_21_14_0_20_45_26]PIW63642.1 MAG: hypothetical protein COW12_09085 [Candidatus Omnitrophica bacterium CG12_big_fil_rev_8_21_14_0_65_45_16]